MQKRCPPADWCPDRPKTTASMENSPPPYFIAEYGNMWHGLSLRWVGVICPTRVPSQPPAHPILLAVGAEWGAEKAWVLCKLCSATAKTLGCYQRRFGHKSKRQHRIVLQGRKLTPSQLDPVPRGRLLFSSMPYPARALLQRPILGLQPNNRHDAKWCRPLEGDPVGQDLAHRATRRGRQSWGCPGQQEQAEG